MTRGYGPYGIWRTALVRNKDTGVTIIHMASIDAEGGAVTLNLGYALLDMADIINNLLKDKKF